MNWTEINKRQNEKMLLECQFAARYYFNCGEKLNYCVWGACVLSALVVFLPNAPQFIKLGIPLSLELTALVFSYFIGSSVKKAAKLRAYFDAYVLDLDYCRYSDYDKRIIKEIVARVVKRRGTECQIQISHTGRDKPPGVLNWYELNSNVTDDNSQYQCQMQNCWWNQQLFKGRILVTCIFGLIIIAIYVSLILISNETLIGGFCTFICSGGLIAKFGERSYLNYKYYKLSVKIEGVEELLSLSKDAQQIQKLQEMLNERREMPVFEMNKMHECFAKKLSELQDQIRN